MSLRYVFHNVKKQTKITTKKGLKGCILYMMIIVNILFYLCVIVRF